MQTKKRKPSSSGCSIVGTPSLEELGEAAEESLRSIQQLVERLNEIEGSMSPETAEPIASVTARYGDTTERADNLLASVLSMMKDVKGLTKKLTSIKQANAQAA